MIYALFIALYSGIKVGTVTVLEHFAEATKEHKGSNDFYVILCFYQLN